MSSPERPDAAASRRGFWLMVPALYVAASAVRAGDGRLTSWLLIGASIAVALLAARPGKGEPAEELFADRITLGGLSVALATSSLAQRPDWAALARELAALGAALVAIRALARTTSDAGLAAAASLAAPPRGLGARSLSRAGMAVVTLSWGIPAALDAAAWVTGRASVLGPSGPILAASCGAASLFALGATALALATTRRLELGAPPRLFACAGAAALGLVFALVLALGGAARADAATALGTTLAAIGMVRLARAKDARSIARVGRRTLTLAIYGGPAVALGAVAIEARALGPTIVALGLGAAAVALGTLAPKLEEPFLPERGAWLGALSAARDVARDRDARAAIASVLVKLREAAGPNAPSPELWVLHPTRVFTVDAAGYLKDRRAELPVLLSDVARGEPHATVRADVLRALEVRRADLRPLLHWLDDRSAIFATVIAEDTEADGVLVVPAVTRADPLTLEEVLAAKQLADAFVGICQAQSARERHLERERELKARIDTLDDELSRLHYTSALEAGRHALASARLARPASVGIYSAASRMAFEALERRIAQDAPVALVARAGIDPVPYLARAHLSGPRRDGPLVIVDGTSSREHDLARWKDDRVSPLALADRGLMVLVDGAALPRDVQVLVARTLAERRPPWERATPLDIAAAITAVAPPEDLTAEGRLAPELFARFEEARPITLPALRDRSEDLRSIVADRLAREGLRVLGRPVGIEAAAFARLVEHPFEGEDAELASIVTQLVARATGDIVRASDMDAIGLGKPEDDERDVAPRATSAADA
jgi:hypothetical protein